nr:integrase, catalytic region, zinc finger, CCHC-type, peptidase aspartic, catalytic [Tanacetum cinerariifolium]
MARQCTQPKRQKNSTWFKEKIVLVQAQEAGQGLDEERLTFLADLEVAKSQDTQTTIIHNDVFLTDDLDAFDSDCDEAPCAEAVLMANLSHYDSNAIFEVPILEPTQDNSILDNCVPEMYYSNQSTFDPALDIEITTDSNIISYDQYLKETENAVVQNTASTKQQNVVIMSVFEEITNRVAKCNVESIQNKNVNESLTAKLERFKEMVVQIVVWYLDSGCSKYMTGQRSQLINFVKKFLVTIIFGNDHIAKIIGYGDYQIRNVIISWVYYVEGHVHNLFLVGQFCDSGLEVAFQKHTCFVRNLEGADLLTGSKDTNLYTLSLANMMWSSPICHLSKASKTKSWLRHRRLSHLNFATINELAKQGLKLKEKQLEEEQAAKAQSWKLPVCYDDDDDEESSNSLKDNIISELPSYFAITPNEPVDSLSMGDEHLDTVSATESDEFIKSCVENLIPNPSVLANFFIFLSSWIPYDLVCDGNDDRNMWYQEP